MASISVLWCIINVLCMHYSTACNCNSKTNISSLSQHNTNKEELIEFKFAEVSSFPDIQPGSVKDQLYSQWHILERNGKVSVGDLSQVEKIFNRARKKLPHSYNELIRQRDKTIRRGKRHIFSEMDSRVKVTDPREYPYSAIVSIKGRGCTGFFVGPKHILTAGHCVYNITSGIWYKDLDFYRGKNCDPDKGVFYKWKKSIIPAGYKDYKHPAYDYAMIISYKKSRTTMNFGWTYNPKSLSSVRIAGYPSDKPRMCMWESRCEIEDQWSSLLGHKCDTAGGNSGSPVYTYSRHMAIAYCIHRGHIGVMDDNSHGKIQEHFNVCSLITKQRLLMFSKWISHY